jgi:hypothetical protein
MCKSRRFIDKLKRQDQLLFGVCTACENHVLKHFPREPGLHLCTCQPAGYYRPGSIFSGLAWEHMCREHDLRNWQTIVQDAATEIDIRRRMVRKRARRRRYPYDKRKPTKTPAERRKATILTDTVQAIPRCYCGNKLPAARHNRPPGPPPPGLPAVYMVRNCVGCCEFHYSYN